MRVAYRTASLVSLLSAIMLAGAGQVWAGAGMLGLCFVTAVASEE